MSELSRGQTPKELTNGAERTKRYYIITRIVRETFQVFAIDKADAARQCEDPCKIEVIKETIKLIP